MSTFGPDLAISSELDRTKRLWVSQGDLAQPSLNSSALSTASIFNEWRMLGTPTFGATSSVLLEAVWLLLYLHPTHPQN